MKTRIWTQKEIDILRSGFNAGKLVKTLANEIGRSPSAVNKYLSRSGIRTRRWKIIKEKRPKICLDCNLSLRTERKKPIEQGSSFIDIVSYLREKGYTVAKNNSLSSMEKYLVNNKPFSETKMLLFANRLRREENKEVFCLAREIWE